MQARMIESEKMRALMLENRCSPVAAAGGTKSSSSSRRLHATEHFARAAKTGEHTRTGRARKSEPIPPLQLRSVVHSSLVCRSRSQRKRAALVCGLLSHLVCVLCVVCLL